MLLGIYFINIFAIVNLKPTRIKANNINDKVFFNVILCIFKYSIGDLFSFFNKKIKREIESTNAKENPISSLNLKISCKKIQR